MYRALLLTGVAGVGKSTVANAVGGVLTSAGHVTAVVDADMLAQFGPPPNGDLPSGRFYDELKCTNLAAVWANYQAAGARYLVVAAVIDGVAQRERYAASLAGCEIRLVRLIADKETVVSRLRRRDIGSKLEKHLRALDEPSLAPNATGVADFTVTNDRAAADVAAGILVRAGWLDRAR
ncbi:AAA family ATPase [Plantactinospora solaniradicis]|uniref:AAA family ATPase n=1 Tax=Plantactinospora solaniradicis TaxID=1723736 RepID=A0ABW1K9Y9_9ACTN